MTEILEQIKKLVPNYSKISDTAFEGANIILYTKDKGFFLDNGGIIKEVVNTIKKRVELRPDPAITGDMEKSEKIMRELIPEDAKVSDIIFDPQRSRAIIEAEKPGSAIGKQGEILKEIRKKTLWVPLIRRTPSLRSKIIENIRAVLYQNSDYRRKFLDKIGHRIYDGPIRNKKEDWVRVTYLGGGRQVGRSCLFLQTPESKVLLDCGVNVAAPDTSMYPILEAPEFKLEELDAVILSHAHIDHSGLIPYLYKMGFRGPTYCTPPTRDVSALLALDYIGVAFKQARKTLFDSSDVKEMVMHTVCIDYEEVTDITPDLRLTFYNAGHIVGSSLCHLHVGNGLHNLVYTGDLKYLKTKLLEPATSNFPRLETLMIEATYGGKENILGSRMKAEDGMIEVINKAIDGKGKGEGSSLRPGFGLGRHCYPHSLSRLSWKDCPPGDFQERHESIPVRYIQEGRRQEGAGGSHKLSRPLRYSRDIRYADCRRFIGILQAHVRQSKECSHVPFIPVRRHSWKNRPVWNEELHLCLR